MYENFSFSPKLKVRKEKGFFKVPKLKWKAGIDL